MSLPTEPKPYHAYLLRIWLAPGATPPTWHASLEDPHTGERRGFANLTEVFEFLAAQTGSGPEQVGRPGAGRA